MSELLHLFVQATDRGETPNESATAFGLGRKHSGAVQLVRLQKLPAFAAQTGVDEQAGSVLESGSRG